VETTKHIFAVGNKYKDQPNSGGKVTAGLECMHNYHTNSKIHCVSKKRTPKTGWHNVIKIGPL